MTDVVGRRSLNARMLSRLVIACEPLPAESISSFVQRCCEENVLADSRDLLNLVEESTGTRIHDVSRLVLDLPSLEALAVTAGAPADSLNHLALRELQAATGNLVRQGLHVWPADARVSPIQLVCPMCLAQERYGRTAWEFVQAPVCLVHGRNLIDACSDCGKPFKVGRAVVSHCHSCAQTIGSEVAAPVSMKAVTAAHLVQVPRMVALGTESYNAPIDPMELSALLRLCLLPHEGEPLVHGLELRLDGYACSRRVEALELLGGAMVNGRIDSSRLRVSLLQRWPFSQVLPLDEQAALLGEACRVVELSREVRLLLCHDAEKEPRQSAVEVFAGRPPQIYSLKELAEYLKADERLLAQLFSAERLRAHPPDNQSYDMDEVLSVVRLWRSLWSEEQVDEALGCAGLAPALIDAKLLDSVRGNDGLVWVPPMEVSRLLKRICEVVPAHPASAAGMSLAAALPLLGAERLAWALSQAITGSLDVLAWSAPHKLMDLVVAKDRLMQLVDWPRSEQPMQSD